MRAIEETYHQLIIELEQSRGGPANAAMRTRIARAAHAFQDAMERDGGARDDLKADVHNIVVSLSDGTFSAEGSIRALRRDAKGSVIDAGEWTPDALAGNPVPQPVGTHLDQYNEGDCVGISVIKAFSNTPGGAAILRGVVRQSPDGSVYRVTLPGAPTTVYHLRASELDQYGKHDPAAAAIVGAMFLYFHKDPRDGALPTNKVMELLAGQLGDHARFADRESSRERIMRFLVTHAEDVNRGRMAMVFGGKPGRNGEWTQGDGHAFAVIRIDPASGILTYTNPWNEQTTPTIAIADLAQQAAGTSADFELVKFR
ncbi:hypothetical protein [Paraburkholderia rhizosphaerae]|uniref:hypothetical protein n=1 Tax=Paraburkholderia rhizosphaerae TaxID=480658 RepID=UPI001AB032E9|nr:hypothetical protein [Paraburkholderia rhizosphaerae]